MSVKSEKIAFYHIPKTGGIRAKEAMNMGKRNPDIDQELNKRLLESESGIIERYYK